MYKASQNINIHTKNQELTFNEGYYHLDVLGGWSVNKNGFSFILTNKKTGNAIYPTRSWPIQNLYRFKRAKRIFTFEVVEKGIYSLEFKNPEQLVVRASNLPLFGWIRNLFFNGIVSNKEIHVIVYRK